MRAIVYGSGAVILVTTGLAVNIPGAACNYIKIEVDVFCRNVLSYNNSRSCKRYATRCCSCERMGSGRQSQRVCAGRICRSIQRTAFGCNSRAGNGRMVFNVCSNFTGYIADVSYVFALVSADVFIGAVVRQTDIITRVYRGRSRLQSEIIVCNVHKTRVAVVTGRISCPRASSTCCVVVEQVIGGNSICPAVAHGVAPYV